MLRQSVFRGGIIATHDSIRRLVEHVLSLPDEALGSLGIQDAALCQVWLSNRGAGQNPPAGLDSLTARIQQWLALSEVSSRQSEGRRSQTLLRELIDRLEGDHVDTMSRDELDLIETVYGFAHAAQNPATFERVRKIIAPRRARIAARRASTPAVVGTPTLSARLLVVRSQDILAAPPREISRFAGLELPSRGPVMAHNGHVRVLGDVPEGTTLVVENGACVVDGFVLGRIAVSGNCEVLENLSGVVISRNGDVRARNIVDGAFVVAKRGWVHCRRSHRAKLVFAGNTIRVAERSTRSRFFAPTVKVGECIEGGEIHTSQSVEAGAFRSTPEATLDLVFRRSLSCKDYGEDPGKAMTVDVSHALRCRAELQYVSQQLQLALKEAEDSAETALTYILAGDAAGHVAEEILAAQRRLKMLNRVLLGLRALFAEAEAKMEDAPGDGNAAPGPDHGFMDRLDTELKEILNENPGDAQTQASYDDVVQSRQHLRSGRRLTHSALSHIGERLQLWQREYTVLEETVRQGRDRIRKSMQATELFEEGVGTRSRVLTLRRIMQHAGEKTPNVRLQERVKAPLVVLMARTVEARLAQARKLKEETTRLQQIFDQAREVVWGKYQMRIDAGDSAAHRIAVEGRFETSARLWADPAYLTLPAGEVPKGGSCVVAATAGRAARYVCVGNFIAEEPVEGPAEEPLAAAS